MAEIMKKKRNEVIKKVRIKLACSCRANCVNQSCDCPCTMDTSPSGTGHGSLDADICATIYWDWNHNVYVRVDSMI